VKGKLAANVDYLTRLYKTKLAINTGDKLQLIFKSANASAIQVKLGIAENANAFTTFNLTSTTTKNGWTVATVDLSSLASKTVSVIALNFKSASEVSGFEATLGQLAVLPAGYAPQATTISNMQIQNQLTQDGGDIRIIWDAPASKDVHHYNVYMIRDGKSTLVGQTRNEGFYIPKFNRSSPQEQSVKVAVSAVTGDLQEGTQIQTEVKYPDIEKPEVSVKAFKTLGKVNDIITLVAKATNFPDSYAWTVPQGAEKVYENQDTVKFKFIQEGVFDIQVAVTNRIGTTNKTAERLVEISNAKTEDLKIVSVKKAIHSASGSLPPEDPSNLIDGVEVPGSVRDKWCIGGSKEHWVIIDLLQPYALYRFKIFDCGHKENYSDNFKNFKIWVSNDAENWTLVVDEKNRPENTKDDYIAPQVGRYVKFMPYDEEKPITIRIWEFEAFGLEGGPLFSMPADQMLNIGEKKDMEITYSLGEAEDANFSYTLTSSAPTSVKISDVTIDKTAGKINFKVEGLEIGASKIKLELRNGAWLKSKEFTLSVDDPSYATNILENKSVVAAKYLYYGSSWYDTASDALTDGNIETATAFTTWVNAQNFYAIIDCGKLYDIAKFKILTNVAPGAIEVYGANENSDVEYSLIASVTPTSGETSFYAEKTTCRYVKVKMAFPAQAIQIFEIMAFGKENGGEIVESVNTPLVIKSGFNADVIAENKPSKNYSSGALDDQGWVFYTSAVQENGAITADGTLTSTSGIIYNLGDVAANNAVLLKSNKTADVQFEGAQKAQRLYFLTTSANGSSSLDVTVHYTDGTSEPTTTFSLDDWFGGSTSGTAKTGMSRIIRATSGSYYTDDIDDRYEFRLFENSIKVDDSKVIDKVNLQTKSAAYPVIFAITKKSSPDDVTGLDQVNKTTLRVYPNPVQNGSVLHVESTEGATIELMSLQGSLLFQQQAVSDHTVIQVNGFAQGTYILVVRDNDGVQTTKVVIR
ncbi:MAG: discoidin domain-containing protein, partial [Bacteroidales bacterium]